MPVSHTYVTTFSPFTPCYPHTPSVLPAWTPQQVPSNFKSSFWLWAIEATRAWLAGYLLEQGQCIGGHTTEAQKHYPQPPLPLSSPLGSVVYQEHSYTFHNEFMTITGLSCSEETFLNADIPSLWLLGSSVMLPEPWEMGSIDDPCEAKHFTVPQAGHFDQVWVSVLTTSYGHSHPGAGESITDLHSWTLVFRRQWDHMTT